MQLEKLFTKLSVIILTLGLLAMHPFSVLDVQASETIRVNSKDGSISYNDNYDGPRVEKIRVLTEDNYLEIYWDRYVDETEAIDISNFTLKNGNTTLSLQAKGSSWTNTLYFDRANKEIAATSANSMARLDPDLHMSSICFNGSIDSSKGLTLEIKGSSIKDENGKSALDATYTEIPYISFYTQFVTSDTGIVVKSDDTVARSSLEAAAEQIDVMLSKTENGIAANMASYNCSLAVYSPHQNVYLIPEHRYGFSKDMYDVEGYGGNLYNNCVSSIAEQNIIRTRNSSQDWYLNTMYRNENILIHEFGHCVKSVGMDLLKDQTLREEFLAAYDHAKKNNLWPNTYCISNEDEFFATICTIWFNVMDEASGWTDGVRGPVNTRFELQQYDPLTYDVFAQILPDTQLPAPWNTDIPDSYHDKNYDPNFIPEPEPSENKKDLKKAINRAIALDTNLYAEEAATILSEAIEKAQLVYNDINASDEDIHLATAALIRVIETLPPLEGNLAYCANVSTSHVSDWESLDAVNDGAIAENSYNPSGVDRYGSWGNTSEAEIITYSWNYDVTLKSSDIYFWYDGAQDNYTSGGIQIPKEYSYEYLDTEGNWQPVRNPSAYHTTMDTYNNTTFDEITTTAIRVTMVKQSNDSNGVGVLEWKVYGEFADSTTPDDPKPDDPMPDDPEPDDPKPDDPEPDDPKPDDPEPDDPEPDNPEPDVPEPDDPEPDDPEPDDPKPDDPKPDVPEPDDPEPDVPDIMLPYVDVIKGDWYYDAVFYNYQNKWMTGLDDTHFGPNDTLARAQFAVILHRMNHTPEVMYTAKFPDVPDNIWFTDAILWASNTGVVTGYTDTGHFGPADNITREQMAVMMYRYANYLKQDTSIKASFDQFSDAAKVSSFAQEAMQWAVGNQIITGKDHGTVLDPQGNATRAECATIIQRFLEKQN